MRVMLIVRSHWHGIFSLQNSGRTPGVLPLSLLPRFSQFFALLCSALTSKVLRCPS
ncbi:hypothetical protein BC827DRAFT_1217316 [Russula dissimulans]|nr:hypothetical protein BC827DRAFT_1217316 [Russula dissimulans]